MIILRQKEYSTGSKLLAGAALVGGTALGAAIGGSIKPKVTDKDIESEIESHKYGSKKDRVTWEHYQHPSDKDLEKWYERLKDEDKESIKNLPKKKKIELYKEDLAPLGISKPGHHDKQIEKLKNRDPEALEDIKRTKKNANKILGGMAGLGVSGAGLLAAKIIGKHKKKNK